MPHPTTLPFRAMARNNAWANHRLLHACLGLSQAEFEATRTSFFPSLKATLNHILVVDRFYVDALEGGLLGPAAWSDPAPCPTVAALIDAQAATDRRLIAFTDTLDAAGLQTPVRLNRGARGILEDRVDRILLHLFQHDIHHRGQAHAMLSGTSVAPPQLDDFFCVADAALRQPEFTALGWSEASVWGDSPSPNP